ncbi:MAG: hypothetical protein WCF84_18570 [Anaerolineae bacterium]
MLSDQMNPKDRMTKNDPDRVHVVGTIVEMILILAILVLFNFFPDRIGVVQSLMDPSSFKPLLAPEFQTHMPWLNLYWGLALSLCVLNLTLGRWTLYARWAELGLNALAAYIFLRMALGGSLSVYPGLTLLVKLGLAVALIVTGIEIIRKLIRLLSRELAVAPPEQP